MTKHFVIYSLVTVGVLAIIWAIFKGADKERPYTVSVSTDDPNMIIPDFGGKIDWGLENPDKWRELVTTYVQK